MFLLVPAYPGSPGQKAVKWLCVCVCVCVAGGGRVSVDSIGLLQVVSVVQQTQHETRAASPSSSTPRKATGT